jgi:predicted lipoprotein with Yx(FWY)xxD motif
MRSRTLLALVTVCILTLAACSDDGGGDDASPAADDTATEQPAEETDEPADDDTGGGATLAVADSDLGEILVDADGLTAYAFFSDEQGGGESTCSGDCASTWPPIVVEGEPAADDGVDASLLGTIEREDGSTQVTYDGWPLYLFASDAAPGDVNGQGVGGIWYVVGPDGTPIEDAAMVASGGGPADRY